MHMSKEERLVYKSERRRTLRYHNLLVRRMVQMKNKIAMLLMEAGVTETQETPSKIRTSRSTAPSSTFNAV
jgi:hypothetical protein